MSSYRHHVPGRLRIRSRRIKNQPAAADAVQQLMRSVPGVQAALANTLTGSVTIHYDVATTADSLVGVLHAHGYIQDPSIPQSQPSLPNGEGADVAGRIASRLAGAVAEKAVERAVFAMIAAVL